MSVVTSVKPCTTEDCTRPAKARGMCMSHYHAAWRAGAIPRPDPSKRHRLSDVDREAQTGTCSICGPDVAIRITGSSQSASCRQRERNTARKTERKRNLVKRYDMKDAAWHAMLIAQSGRCAICEKPMKRPHVDHDHAPGATRQARGMLCPACNQTLGLMHDSPERLMSAARYLEAAAARRADVAA